MISETLLTEIEKHLHHCPLCGSILAKRESPDKFIASYECEASHHWYMNLINQTYNDILTGLDLQTNADDPMQIIKSWITIPELRAYLHPDTASCLRGLILKSDKLVQEYSSGSKSYKSCITCGALVTPEKPYDWDNPYICTNGHHQATRGFRYYRYIKEEGQEKGFHVEIQWERTPSDAYIYLCELSKPTTGGFFKEKIKPSIFVPQQIIKVLQKLKNI